MGVGGHLRLLAIRDLRKPGLLGMPGPVWTLLVWQVGSLLVLTLSLVSPMNAGATGVLPRVIAICYTAVMASLLALMRTQTPAWVIHLQVALAIIVVWGLIGASVTAVGQVTVAQTLVVLALYVGSWMSLPVALGYVLVADAGLLVLLVSRGYISGPLVPWVMLTAISVGLVIAASVLVRQLRAQAVTDLLTGLRNRAGLAEVVDDYSRGRHARIPRSVIVIDIDGLKVVNDRDGHSSGDELLKRFAQDLQSAVRGSDIPVRTGGDEFVVLLSRTTLVEAEAVARRLIEGTSVACSFGVAQWDPGEPFDAAWTTADRRMYDQKVERGRARRAP